jgi:DNA-binding NarL/FixJ family response regulator
MLLTIVKKDKQETLTRCAIASHNFNRIMIIIGKCTGEKILMNSEPSQTPATLSDRELEILNLVSDGLTNDQIAKTLEISKRTVDNHVSNILDKTKTKNRVELVRWALHWGKVCLDDVNCCALPLSEPQTNPQQALS